jgi:hypothetical protein
LGDQIKLVGVSLQGVDMGDKGTIPSVEATPGLPLLLAWQPIRPPNADYITFVHLMAADGTLAAQYDRAPLQGVAPTTLWHEDDILLDTFQLDLPPDLPPGEYRLLVGLYNLSTLTRLLVQIDDLSAGDAIHVATVLAP